MSNKEEWYDTYDIMYEHFKEMQEKSADYSAGYRAGWNDCYKMFRDLISKKEEKPVKEEPLNDFENYKKLVEEAAKKTQNTYTYPYIPTPQPQQPWHNVIRSCPQCGLQLTDSLGRPIPLGYVCNNRNCPTFPQVSWSYGTGTVPGTVRADSTPTYTIPLDNKPGTYSYEWRDGGSVSYTSNTIWINPRS